MDNHRQLNLSLVRPTFNALSLILFCFVMQMGQDGWYYTHTQRVVVHYMISKLKPSLDSFLDRK